MCTDDCLHDDGLFIHLMLMLHSLHMLMSDDRHQGGLLTHMMGITHYLHILAHGCHDPIQHMRRVILSTYQPSHVGLVMDCGGNNLATCLADVACVREYFHSSCNISPALAPLAITELQSRCRLFGNYYLNIGRLSGRYADP